MKTIPKSLLDLLAQEWQAASRRTGSAFESVFEEEDRRRNPSFYFASEGSPSTIDMLQFDEVSGLLRDGVLNHVTAVVRRRPSGTRYTATNEHAQHAIYDFCEAVYAGWDQLQQRLAAVEQESRVPANHNSDPAPDAQVAQVGVVTH